MQGLALGGEYGGATIFVSEHCPPNKRGFYTGFIQASVVGGFVLSLIVVLGCKLAMSEATWDAWGWRAPFVLSLVLLAISLWMRLKLSESPVFQAMRAEGQMAKNPFKESFTYPGNPKRLFVALFGVAAGLTVIWYTAMFRGLSFLTGPMRVDETAAEIIVGIAALIGMSFFVFFGSLSDRIGRKAPIVWGYALTLILLFPLLLGDRLGDGARRWPSSGPDVKITPGGTQIIVIMGALLTLVGALGRDLRLGRRLARRDVPAEDPLQLGVDPLSLRHRLLRRLPAADRHLDRRPHRQSVFRTVVHLGRGAGGLDRGDLGLTGRTAPRFRRDRMIAPPPRTLRLRLDARGAGRQLARARPDVGHARAPAPR